MTVAPATAVSGPVLRVAVLLAVMSTSPVLQVEGEEEQCRVHAHRQGERRQV